MRTGASATADLGSRDQVESDQRVLAASPQPPGIRQLVGLVGCVAVCDVTIYRGEGFAGAAVLFLLSPALLWLSARRSVHGRGLVLIGVMFVLLAGRMVWQGSDGLVLMGFALLVPFSMLLTGFRIEPLAMARFAMGIPWFGVKGLIDSGKQFRIHALLPRAPWIKVVFPALALIVFGTIFVQANPQLLTWVSESLARAVQRLQEWFDWVSPQLLEAFFWLFVTWMVLGLVWRDGARAGDDEAAAAPAPDDTRQAMPAHVYAAFRNTLLAVNLLFAGYLIYEFATLWFREFEEGFHYSGYAHEGAVWLTVALGLATLVLGLVFRGGTEADARLGVLKRLAWTWSSLNGLLALAVYNRLLIYIDFNGLTPMRIVGLFGISTVVVGFVLVVRKIAGARSFAWLVHRQLVALSLAIFLFALTPVDAIWVGFNVDRILSGDLAPAVQLSVHRFGPEGVPRLVPGLECRDETIREGIRALLAEHHEQLGARVRTRRELGWTTWQLAEQRALEALEEHRGLFQRYAEPQTRQRVRLRFDEYTYQWY